IASPEFGREILEKIYEIPPPGKRYLYLPFVDPVVELRPGIYLDGFVRKDVWDKYVIILE
ncbi:MAG: hypothetical protein KFF73_12465, partial [Cyclobacteriaceae bacterium]|nr:hypothetical protein [Cyclobacteriaceae bacterium]